MNSIVTYETQHGSAKKAGLIISEKLGCKCINVDTPFEAEDLKDIDNIILVFNFRGPYTAQLTKLYLSRVKEQLINKNIFLVGEGLFSEKEFPIVAGDIHDKYHSKGFETFFIKGQLRIKTLYPEEKVLLKKFGELTGMEIKDMGEFDNNKANEVGETIANAIANNKIESVETKEESKNKWICPICGYIHYGDNPPEKCPLCGAPGNIFKKEEN